MGILSYLELDPPKSSSAKDVWVGDYDFYYLCMPSWPYCRTHARESPEFYGRNEWMGVIVGLLMGLQHTVAMAGGLITPPIIIAGMSGNPDYAQLFISWALIVCGISSAFQVSGFRIYRNIQYGSGVLSVMGISFATLPIAQAMISTMMAHGKTFDEAYGAVLGTVAICAITGIIISFLPHAVLEFLFPPVVCGITLSLIGIGLVGTGIKQWGGGVYCGDNYAGLPATKYTDCTYFDPVKNATIDGTCQSVPIIPTCGGNGDVKLTFGAWQYLVMGSCSFFCLIFLEIFGSPFMRNAAAVIALIFGYILAACIKFDGNGMIAWYKLVDAPWVTFLWVKTFPLSIYAPGIIPICLVFCILAIESVGDVTGTEDVSREETSGPDHERRIRGGLLNDALSSMLSALAGTLPVTTFAQNNGVIALTNVASRYTGYFAAIFLVLMGVLAKIGAWVTTIPDCVLGGVTTFLFSNVIASGIKIMIAGGLTRRIRYIMACCFGVGIGVTLCPQWAHYFWVPSPDISNFMSGIRDTCILILDHGFVIGALMAIFLNLVLPAEKKDDEAVLHEEEASAMSFYGPIQTVSMTSRDKSAASRLGVGGKAGHLGTLAEDEIEPLKPDEIPSSIEMGTYSK